MSNKQILATIDRLLAQTYERIGRKQVELDFEKERLSQLQSLAQLNKQRR